MITLEEQNSLLDDISKALKKRIEAYAIGGTAMMFLGLKESTLDIDLVFENKEDMEVFKEAAMRLGYNEMDHRIAYKKDNAPDMITMGDNRIDLFVNEVVYFTFTDSMRKRAADAIQYGDNLVLGIADHHDIILMKCATDRKKDKDDVKRIIENKDMDWNIIIEAAKEQVSIGKKKTIFELGCFLEDLTKIDVEVPQIVLDELYELV
jgi:hypothetical protein